MYKSDYFTVEQMTKYKMQLDTNKAWDPTLDHFSKIFAQRKAYGNDHTANSGFMSAASMYDIPSNRTIAMIKSSGDFISGDLYIESLEESLTLACNYVTNALMTAPAPYLLLILWPLCILTWKHNANSLNSCSSKYRTSGAFLKASVSTNPGSAATPKPRGTGCKHSQTHLKECPNCKKMCTHKPADCFSLAANADKHLTNWKVPLST